MRLLLCVFCVASLVSLFGCGESAQQALSVEQSSPQANVSSEPAMVDVVEPSDSDSIEFGDKFPEVLAVEAVLIENDRWRFSVTLSSTYDSPSRYADGWRVLDDQDNELGIRVLGHDHANEQPFTRSGTIEVPNGTSLVFVEGRDQANGWSGQRFKFELP